MQMDSPIANGKPIARESCDFLVGSTVVNGTNVTAGPHALPGTALLTPNHDGAEPRRFYLENGEPFSHTFSSTGMPAAWAVRAPGTVAPERRAALVETQAPSQPALPMAVPLLRRAPLAAAAG
jgi:hypothetical protein